MAWMNMLYRTYENNVRMAGKTVAGQAPLSPVAHMPANAQIEITIDEEGNFRNASVIEKDERKTLIPVTEKSQGRASGTAPHPLCDTLSYLAGDFSSFVSDLKESKTSEERYNAYLSALKMWTQSDYSHPKVKAVYAYAKQQRMTDDLIRAGILECSQDGKLSDKKVSGKPYKDALVRFRVLSSREESSNAVWEDATLFDSYTNYYSFIQEGRRDICYLTGKTETISGNHPKGIIAANYGAKLVSANDKSGFTFRGRFYTAEEAFAVGYEGSQKAHAALTWLAGHQGVPIGNKDKRTYICWNPNGKKLPNIIDDFTLVDDDESTANTDEGYKARLEKALRGYVAELDQNDDIVIIALDAATTGRLSVTYYNELKASDFLERLHNWGETCCWYFKKFKKGEKPEILVKTPSIYQIVRFAFGCERKSKDQQSGFVDVDDKVAKEQSQQILYCMLDKKPVPYSLIHALTARASMRSAYSDWNYENLLSTTCALIVKYHNDKSKGVKITMKLDYENTDRSYLFGRLLAVAEKVERAAFSREENREPNAVRLQSAFVRHPMLTWSTLETALKPYYQKLFPYKRKLYKDIISSIVEALPDTDKNTLDRPLDETYLIGYYLQRAELERLSKKETQNDEEDTVL